MESVVLKGEDFKTVHNTLCELRSVQQQLCGVVNDRVLDQITAAIRGFELGLRDAYDQDSAAFERKSEHYEQLRTELGLRSIWSIYSVSDLRKSHPYTAAREICYRDHWGEAAVYEPTWADLFQAADHAIRRSGDGHHVFIESFEPVADQPRQLRLTTGS
jgi:hypothetical protein